MAKRFAGFTPEQMGKIIPEMKGMQADEQAMFLASKPGAASRVGKMAELAQKRIGMASGGYVKRQGYAVGGTPTPNTNGGFDYVGGPALPPGEDLITSPGEQPLPPIDDPVTTPLYSGPMTTEVSKNILKMSTGQTASDLQYDFNSDGKITSQDALAAAKQGVAQGTVTTGTGAGGFADIQYDPTTGLPPAPEKVYTDSASAIDAAFENPNWNEGTTGVNANLTNVLTLI